LAADVIDDGAWFSMANRAGEINEGQVIIERIDAMGRDDRRAGQDRAVLLRAVSLRSFSYDAIMNDILGYPRGKNLTGAPIGGG
jgi:hypothetical protein